MTFDLDAFLRVAQIAVMVAAVALNVFLFLRSANRETVARLRRDQADGDAALSGRLDGVSLELRASAGRDADLNTRVSVLETRLAHVPTHADLVGIRTEMREMNAAIAAINERSETTHEQVVSIHRYLLQKGHA